ncbi:Brp/Blh family beta-carotene 15,15'-dioxygenase [Spirosoma aerophilum]
MITSTLKRLGQSIERTPTYLTILAGTLLVSYEHWIGPLSVTAQLIFCGSLLLVVGIPHGALDHLIEEERISQQAKPFSLARFLAKYIVMIVLYGLAWLFFPVLCLCIFLLISAWHFGETDLEHAPDDIYWSFTRLIAGGFVLGFILLAHATEVTPILARIVQDDPKTMTLWAIAVNKSGALLRGWATLGIVLTMLSLGHRPTLINGWRLVRLGTVLLLTYSLPLLPAFMLYFGGWHSLSSFGLIQSYLHRSAHPARSIWKLWQQSIPFTVLAFGFLLAGAGIWNRYMPYFDPLPYLFILLSTITLPHIQVMRQLNLPAKRLAIKKLN